MRLLLNSFDFQSRCSEGLAAQHNLASIWFERDKNIIATGSIILGAATFAGRYIYYLFLWRHNGGSRFFGEGQKFSLTPIISPVFSPTFIYRFLIASLSFALLFSPVLSFPLIPFTTCTSLFPPLPYRGMFRG